MKGSGPHSRQGSFSKFLFHGLAMAAAVLILLLAATPANSRGKPQIVRHEANVLEHAVIMIIQWQSPNPVVRVTATVGGRKKEVEVDPYNNQRNQDGYWGEVTLEVKSGRALETDGIPYILQVEDDLRQKSELVKGKAQGSAAESHSSGEDTWGRQHLERPGIPGQLVPEGTSPPYGGGTISPPGGGQDPQASPLPTIQLIDVTVSSGQVIFTMRAYDQSGLQVINYLILDEAGALVQERQIPSQGPEFNGPTEAIPLPPGNYKVSAQAVGSSGITSSEETRDFVVEDEKVGEDQK